MHPWFIRNDHPDFSQKKLSRPLPVKNLCPSSRRPDLFIGGAGRVVLSCPDHLRSLLVKFLQVDSKQSTPADLEYATRARNGQTSKITNRY